MRKIVNWINRQIKLTFSAKSQCEAGGLWRVKMKTMEIIYLLYVYFLIKSIKFSVHLLIEVSEQRIRKHWTILHNIPILCNIVQFYFWDTYYFMIMKNTLHSFEKMELKSRWKINIDHRTIIMKLLTNCSKRINISTGTSPEWPTDDWTGVWKYWNCLYKL